MGILSFLGRFNRGGRPVDDHQIKREYPKKEVSGRPGRVDHHRKQRLCLRVEPHIAAGIKLYAQKEGYTVSYLASSFFSTLMYSKSQPELLKLIAEQQK